MAGYRADLDRRVVPRWRRFDESLWRGELDPSIPPQERVSTSGDPLARKLADWFRHRTVAHASDVAGAALVLGRPEDAREPAEFLLRTEDGVSQWAKELASHVLTGYSANTPHLPSETTRQMLHREVHSLRKRVRREPRDSVRWVDLALAYATLGLDAKASENMNVAVHLAPNNRFVVRSASRLFVHLKEPDRAHELVLKSDQTPHDPWLLAAEVAVGSIAERTPRFVKQATRTIADQVFPPAQISELAAAAATVELRAGSIRKAKRLFRKSLEEPTENSVAQARWAARMHSVLNYGDSMPRTLGAFEAESWRLYENSQWQEALYQSKLWQFDQPFSSRPGCHGSFIACVAMRDYVAGEKIARDALVANRDDFTLLNNLTFSLINQDRFLDASKVLSKLENTQLSTPESIVLEATSGLLDYRNGNYLSGHQKYLSARERARTKGWRKLQALASAFHAMEEAAVMGSGYQALRDEADALMSNQEDPIFGVLTERLASMTQPRGLE